jgi:putative ABC transport system substrate-binding protein
MTVEDTPVIYAMVFSPESATDGQKNITGVSMNISPEKQFQAIREVLPDAKRVGIVYNPERSARLFGDAQSAASKHGITLVPKEAHALKEVFSAINELKGEIDAFWMLPDVTVITKETIEHLFLFSFENDIPIISFSEKYVEMGALMALAIDAEDIGMQAGEIANEILSGASVGDIPMHDPRRSRMFLNLRTAERMGIKIDKEIIRKSTTVK